MPRASFGAALRGHGPKPFPLKHHASTPLFGGEGASPSSEQKRCPRRVLEAFGSACQRDASAAKHNLWCLNHTPIAACARACRAVMVDPFLSNVFPKSLTRDLVFEERPPVNVMWGALPPFCNSSEKLSLKGTPYPAAASTRARHLTSRFSGVSAKTQMLSAYGGPQKGCERNEPNARGGGAHNSA